MLMHVYVSPAVLLPVPGHAPQALATQDKMAQVVTCNTQVYNVYMYIMFTRMTYVCRTNRMITSGYTWHICPVPTKSDTYIPMVLEYGTVPKKPNGPNTPAFVGKR
jgi:hypothetical protein